MSIQRNLFDPPAQGSDSNAVPPVDRFCGAMVFSAIGDALGWPTEFLKERPSRTPPFTLPLRDFVSWQKFVGGRWWGYRDEIAPGEYSDDTQLTLAIARSISSSGEFEPRRFAYSEFPLWLHYERGGGRSIKTAARTLIRRKVDWLHNFYKQGAVDYRMAGANGAAMRNLPIALVSFADEKRLLRDSFFNAIISHGHPRGILGTLLLGLAVRYALIEREKKIESLVEYLREAIERVGQSLAGDENVDAWVETWEKRGKAARGTFKKLFAETRSEAHEYLGAIRDFMNKPIKDYYEFVGALNPSTKGSGLGTVCVAIYLFLRSNENPDEVVYDAANMLGSDTDTIASFVGALVGAHYGTDVIPKHLWEKIQDREYLAKTASRLHAVASGKVLEQRASGAEPDQKEAYLRILAWEIGLHEMFWDAIDVGGSVVHPTLGRGIIRGKEVREIAREGYVAKLIRIQFDCGQSCIFHSRVENNDKVSESLAKAVEKALR